MILIKNDTDILDLKETTWYNISDLLKDNLSVCIVYKLEKMVLN